MDPDALPAMDGDETAVAESVEELDVDAFEEVPEELAEEEALSVDESSLVPKPPEPAERRVPPPPPPAPVVDYAMPVQTSGMAIASLVMGIAGWTLLPLVGSILAIIFGYAARRDIRRRPDELTGEGMAIAGLVLGWIMVGLSVIGLCLGVIALCLIPVIFTSAVGY
jgi:hypothetical protein